MKSFDVFISCSSEDYSLANEVYEYLEENGVKCFFAGKNIAQSGNSNYRAVIDNAIDASNNMIVIGSSVDNINSDWVGAEWNSFINEQRSGRKEGNIITILKEGVRVEELALSLRNVQSFYFSNYRDYLLSYIKKEACEISSNNEKKRSKLQHLVCVIISLLMACFVCFCVMNYIVPISQAKVLYANRFEKEKKEQHTKNSEKIWAIVNQMDSVYSVARKCSIWLDENNISFKKLPDIYEYASVTDDYGYGIPIIEDEEIIVECMDECLWDVDAELNPNLINYVSCIEKYYQLHQVLDSLYAYSNMLKTKEAPKIISSFELRKTQYFSILGNFKNIIKLLVTFFVTFCLSYLVTYKLFHFLSRHMRCANKN